MNIGDTFQFNSREWIVKDVNENEKFPLMREDLKRRGWDGKIYNAVSYPVGRQRKTLQTFFYKSVHTGEMATMF